MKSKPLFIFAGATMVSLLSATPALADLAPEPLTGNVWVAGGIVLVLVVIVVLFIRGALSISKGDKSDEDEAGVGVLEGIDEDDDSGKKKKK